MEGKYWKRRAEAVIAEYKKWRMFHIMRLLGKGDSSVQDTVGFIPENGNAFNIRYITDYSSIFLLEPYCDH